MVKIKKIYKYTLIPLVTLFLILALSVPVLRTPDVQTYLGKRLMHKISASIRGEVEFGTLNFTFFNRIAVSDLLVRDETGDTLLYSPYVRAGIKRIDRNRRLTRLGRISIETPLLNLRPDSTGRLNLLYFAELLVNKDTARRNREISIDQIRIFNGEIRYNNNQPASISPGTIDLNHVAVNSLYLIIDDLEKLWKNYGMTLAGLSFETSEGFIVEDLFASVEITKEHFYLVDPTLRTSSSIINSKLIGIDFVGRDSSFIFSNDASLNLRFDRSLLSLTDLSYFIKKLDGYDQSFTLSGNIRGTISELKGRDIDFAYSDSTKLLFDFDLSGLPDIEKTFMFIDIDQFVSHTTEIESILIPGKGYISLSPELSRLGRLSFRGNFTGFVTDFVTYGIFTSDLGKLSTDILFSPDTSNAFIYSGSLQATNIDLGRILKKEDLLGKLSFTANVNGSSESFSKFRAGLEGTIDSFDYNKYTYRNIEVNGIFTEKIWDGSLTSNTDDLKLDLLGRFDFSSEVPEFDFTLNLLEANLHKLNFDPSDSTSNLSMLITANMTGNNIDNSNGEIRLLNSRLIKHGEVFDLYDCSLSAVNNETENSLELRTNYVDAFIRGKFSLISMLTDLQTVASHAMPSLFVQEESLYRISDNRFIYEIDFKDTDRINTFFRSGMFLAPNMIISGLVDPDSLIMISAYGDYYTYNKNSLVNFNFKSEVRDSITNFILTCDKLSLVERVDLENFGVTLRTFPDNLEFSTSWKNGGNLRNEGLLTAKGKFVGSTSGYPEMLVEILPSEIWLRGSPWEVKDANIMIDSTSFGIDNFLISHQNDLFRVNGKISEDPSDTLFFELNGLDLSALNNLRKESSNGSGGSIDFVVDGTLGGYIMVTDVYNNPLFESNLTINEFRTNEHDQGNVSLISNWNNIQKVAAVSLRNDISGVNTFNINGSYNPEKRHMDLLTSVDHFPLDILNLVLKSFASGVSGVGTGNVLITGPTDEIGIYGSIMAEEASMTIDYLQTKFNFSDSIIFQGNRFVFNQISLKDDRQNSATLSGYVAHNNFKDFEVDLRMGVDNVRIIDTREKDNDLFYGTAFASGVATIAGPANNLDFNISARTDRNTRLFIPLNAGEEVSDYSFISFVESRESARAPDEIILPIRIDRQKSSVALNIDLDVTPDAEVQLVFDSRTGEIMRARGSGNLNLSLDHSGNFSIFGDYTIEDGDYLLTLGNFINKRFIVEEGGTINWNGDINNTQINIKAIYKLSASLYSLLQLESLRARIPVECHLNMSGNLVNPVIGFDIYLPTADEETRTYLRNAINSEEEMSRQFLYLLVMNNFYSDPAYAGISNTTTTGASAMGVTTTEMLSNQLSNWLSQISNDFDIGFAYRPGNEISSQEVEVALSTQLLNDRVVINGNVDVGGQESTSRTNNISGDFDVEVKLTEKVRFKVFNRSNDNILYESAPYTQGFGLFFRKDFNRLKEIFQRDKSKMKREEEPEIITNDQGSR